MRIFKKMVLKDVQDRLECVGCQTEKSGILGVPEFGRLHAPYCNMGSVRFSPTVTLVPLCRFTSCGKDRDHSPPHYQVVQ